MQVGDKVTWTSPKHKLREGVYGFFKGPSLGTVGKVVEIRESYDPGYPDTYTVLFPGWDKGHDGDMDKISNSYWFCEEEWLEAVT